MLSFIVIQFLIIGGLIWYIQHAENRKNTLHEARVVASDHFLRTVAAGIYQRFSGDQEPSDLFLTDTQTDFISFAAHIVQRIKGGTVYLTHHSPYTQPHFEIERADGTYVGMAIVQATEVTYEKIAVLHSHLIQLQAQGGYVITTSDFSPDAYAYAKNLEIELIHGKQLVTYWLQAIDHTFYEKEQNFRSK